MIPLVLLAGLSSESNGVFIGVSATESLSSDVKVDDCLISDSWPLAFLASSIRGIALQNEDTSAD